MKMELRDRLPSKIFEVIERAGISTPKEILILSVWDIKKLTKLRTDDILLLKNVVADHLCPQSITCNNLITQENQVKKISTGCIGIDYILRGGFRSGTVTEIYGESGSGKTQIAIQAAAYNWGKGAVYICTEDSFPVKRFEQITKGLKDYDATIQYGQNIYVEHLTEASDLLSCLHVRLPKLLAKSTPSLIIVDSITAPFRCEYTNYIQRAEELREVAMALIYIAQKHNLAVLCINQVTASFDEKHKILPSLGLAWSNMISTRLWLRKTDCVIDLRNVPSGSLSKVQCKENSTKIREISIIFAPDLPNSVTRYIITSTGIQSL